MREDTKNQGPVCRCACDHCQGGGCVCYGPSTRWVGPDLDRGDIERISYKDDLDG